MLLAPGAFFLAAATTDAASPEAALVQYGVLGIFALLMIVYIRTNVKREQDRADRLEEENKRLYTAMADKMIPALERSQTSMTDVLEELKASRKERDDDRFRAEAQRMAEDLARRQQSEDDIRRRQQPRRKETSDGES